MGEAFKALGWPRLNYVVSTKFFWGLDREGNTINRKDTLNRKYLMQAIDGSLKRLQLDFVDLVFCHRPDPNTPIEETVWAMSDMITRGKALYWGTSEWTAAEIRAAWDIAERHHLHGRDGRPFQSRLDVPWSPLPTFSTRRTFLWLIRETAQRAYGPSGLRNRNESEAMMAVNISWTSPPPLRVAASSTAASEQPSSEVSLRPIQ